MVNVTRIRFFQTSADIQATVLAAKAQFESQNPGARVARCEIVAASPGDSDGNRWVDVEVQWVR